MKKYLTLIVVQFFIVLQTLPAQSWYPLNGPEGANIQEIKVTPTKLIIGSNNVYNPGGVWIKPLDGPGNNTNVALNIPNKKVQTIGVLGETLFVSNSSHFNESDGGIYRSADGGASWQQVVTQDIGSSLSFLYFHSYNNIIYAATSLSSVYKSTDQGLTWTIGNQGFTSNSSVYCLQQMGPDSLFAGTAKGVYLSTDTGETWAPMNSGINTNSTFGRIYGLAAVGDTMYAATYRNGIYRSVNRGASWTLINNGITDMYITSIYSTGNKVFAINSQGILKLDNTGSPVWVTSNNGLPVSKFKTIFHDGTRLLAGCIAGLFESYDYGATWTDANTGFAGHTIGNQFNAAQMITEANNFIIAGTSNGAIYKSPDQGATWQSTSNGFTTNSFISSIFFNNGTLFATYQSGPIYTSTNMGETWISGTNPISSTQDVLINNGRIWACSYDLMYSDDNGSNWYSESTVPAEVYSICKLNNDLYTLAISNFSSNTSIYKSVGGNSPFEQVGEILNAPCNRIFAYHDTLFALSGETGIFKSTDGGVTWLMDGMDQVILRNYTLSNDRLFVRSRDKIYYRINGSWLDITGGLPPVLDDHDWYNTGLYAAEDKLIAAISSLSLYAIDYASLILPEQPSAMEGEIYPCAGTQVTYSVSSVEGIIYTWQVPAGWIILNGQNTASVTVIAGSAGGLITVTPSNLIGAGPSQYLVVAPVNGVPESPAIIGPEAPVMNTVVAYSCEFIDGASYNWIFPEGWVQQSGGISNSVTVMIGEVPGTIIVTITTNCGTSLPGILNVIPVNEDTPQIFQVTGGGSYCQGTDGLPVGISGSETGVVYTLLRNNIPQSVTLNGTGSELTFGMQTAGTYTVEAMRNGYISIMSGNAVNVEIISATAGVSIITNETDICEGTEVTITAIPENGGIPVYNWFVNNNNAGTNQSTFTFAPLDGDIVHVEMESSLYCATTNPATSNQLTFTVNPEVTPQVTIQASSNPVISGQPVTLTATATNAGDDPVYLWFINGSNVATGDQYTYTPANVDIIYAIIIENIGNERGEVRLFDLTSRIVKKAVICGTTMNIPVNTSGIFILHIQCETGTYSTMIRI